MRKCCVVSVSKHNSHKGQKVPPTKTQNYEKGCQGSAHTVIYKWSLLSANQKYFSGKSTVQEKGLAEIDINEAERERQEEAFVTWKSYTKMKRRNALIFTLSEMNRWQRTFSTILSHNLPLYSCPNYIFLFHKIKIAAELLSSLKWK